MRKLLLLVVFTAAVLSCSTCPQPDGEAPGEVIRIGSFNLEVFGPTKAGKPEVLEVMGEIIRHFDIVAVQEIRDSGGTAVVALAGAVNSTGVSYDYVIGPREGRTSSKEQYVIFYNQATIEKLGTPYMFDEGTTDTFEREPYVAQFRVRGKALDFALVDIHTKPDDATSEISRLPEVMLDAVNRTGEADVVCLGDFNADGSYYDETTFSETFTPDTFIWLIDNSMDTTVAASSNTYDRFVTLKASDEDFTGNAGVYRFDLELQLGSLAPGDVSDHFPVWAEFWTMNDTE